MKSRSIKSLNKDFTSCLAHRHAVVGNTTILEGLCDDRHVSGLHQIGEIVVNHKVHDANQHEPYDNHNGSHSLAVEQKGNVFIKMSFAVIVSSF